MRKQSDGKQGNEKSSSGRFWNKEYGRKGKWIKRGLIALTGLFLLGAVAGCDDEDWDWDEEDDSSNSAAVAAHNYGDIGTVGENGSWAIFVYLCGTDLESDAGMGTDDLEEMLSAKSSSDIRFIVETGGTSEWYNDTVDPDRIQRFVVEDGDAKLVDEKSLSGMGKSKTLQDFVSWGLSNYGAEHNGLILWDHGGGSIAGVCVDELDDCDTLSLREIDNALKGANLSKKLDFVGFDACLMGTIETANILAPYASYMYGSEETEPGSGWDYTEIGNYLAQNPGADGAALGKVVCDSFLKACEELDDDELTTLAVFDLSKLSNVTEKLDSFAGNLCTAASDESKRASIIRGIESAENFGGNNKSEGYTNMVDLGAILTKCASYADGAEEARKAIDEAVIYYVSGSAHRGACGMSIYYPLKIQGSEELSIFQDISVSENYSRFLGVKTSGYQGSGPVYYGEETGESPYISFYYEPGIDDEGYYSFVLDEDGINAAADVCAIVYQLTDDLEDMLELGETYDIYGDWYTGEFYDNFDGYWPSLPDGQNLAIYIVDYEDDYITYTSPILLNDRETNLRLKQEISSGRIFVEGAWDGIDENGIAAREVLKLKNGDVIVPRYTAYEIEGDDDDEFEYVGYEYTVRGNFEIEYALMDDAYYLYAFCIDDIYGDYYISDPVAFDIEDGEVSFLPMDD